MSRATSLAELPDVLTVRQVAVFLGVAENSVYGAIRREELPSVRLGRRVLVGRQSLERWLEGER
ncbi:MAG: helix-turn-helix domain-containing protein [Coriobacteriia bacterium]|nr:helix-turn-helix domain-containing protein [Coriobacteriia bacterium]